MLVNTADAPTAEFGLDLQLEEGRVATAQDVSVRLYTPDGKNGSALGSRLRW